jgi:hypothetical protein
MTITSGEIPSDKHWPNVHGYPRLMRPTKDAFTRRIIGHVGEMDSALRQISMTDGQKLALLDMYD